MSLTKGRNQELTKERIQELVGDYNLWKLYYGDFKLHKKIKSPVRTEQDPSAAFFSTNNSILLKDFGHPSKQIWSIYDYLELKFNLSYFKAITRIQADFGLQSHSSEKMTVMSSNSLIENFNYKVHASEMKVKRKEFSKRELDYWLTYGSIENIKNLHISALSCYWIQKKEDFIEFLRKKDELVFCFSFRNAKYKIYRPEAKNKLQKWAGNVQKDTLMGWDTLALGGEQYFLTKGMKELLSLRTLDLHSEALQGEKNYPTDSIILDKKGKFKQCYTIFDQDSVGLDASKYFEQKYQFIPLYLPKSLSYKDLAEFTKEKGLQETNQLIQQMINDTK